MGEPKAIVDEELLKRFVPINALATNSLRQIAKKAIIAEYKPGDKLFGKGDRDGLTIYLLSGEIDLVAGGQSILVEAGSETARHPIGQHQPRQVDAVARGAVSCIQVETNIVDMVLTWQQSAVEVDEIEQDKSEDWMTRMLQNRLFLKLPPANIQKIMMSMSDIEVSEGETIIRQGEDGDFYYYIRSGRCEVLRQPKPGAPEVKLAELPAGESFGEEALVSEEKRNATVRMLTDGVLMRLSKQDFVKLIHDPLHAIVDYYQAEVLVSDGAAWLDVRLPDEYSNSHINDAINIPLPTLRLQLKQLDKRRPYIVHCDTGRRSSTAAFLMSEQGFNAHVLGGGLMNLPPEVFLVSEHSEDANRASVEMISSQILKTGSPRKAPEKKTERAKGKAEEPAKKTSEKKPAKRAAVKKIAADTKKGTDKPNSAAKEALARARETLEQARKVKSRNGAEAPTAKVSEKVEQAAPVADSSQTKKALEEAEASKMLLQQELHRLEEELARSNSRLEEMLSENQRLEVSLAKQETDNKSAAEEQHRENNEWQEKFDRERESSQQELAKARSSVQELESERNSLRQQIDQIKQDAEKTQRDLQNQIKVDQDGSEHKLKELRDQLEAAQQARARIEADFNAGRQNSEEATEQLRRERTNLEQQLRTEGERHAEELALLKGKLETSQQERVGAEQQRDQLEKENQQLRNDVKQQQSLNEEVERLRIAAERQTQELTALDGQLVEAREQRTIAETAREELERQLGQVASDLEKTQAINEEMAQLRQSQQEMERRLKEAEAVRVEAEEKAQHLASSSENSQAEQQRTREELDFTQRTLTKALMDKEELERNLAESQNQLQKEQQQRENQESAVTQELAQVRSELVELRESLQQVTSERDEAQSRYREAEQARREAEEAAESARSERKARDTELKAELDRLQTEISDYQSRLEQAQQIKEEAEKARGEAEERAGKAMVDSSTRHEELEGQIQEYQTVLTRMEEELDQVGRITEEADSARKQSEGHVQRMAREMERLRNLLKEAEHEKEQAWQARKQAEYEISEARREAVDAIQKANEQVHKAQEDLTRVRSETESEIQRRLEMETNRFKSRDVEPLQVVKDTGPSFHGATTRTEREVTLGSERIRDTQTVTGRQPKQKKSNLGVVMFLILLTVGGVTGFVFKDKLMEMAGMAPAPAPAPKAEEPATPSTKTVADATAAKTATLQTPQPQAKAGAKPKVPAPRPAPTRKKAGTKGVAKGTEIQDAIRGGGAGPVMLQLPGGRFSMGDKTSTDNSVRPQHTVTVKAFAIGKFEVTYEDFERFAQATGREVPDDQGRGRGKHPVVNVSWNDARAYAAWLSEQTGHRYRLPTEAEWEYAARAGQKGAYWWGNAVGSGNANCFNCGSQWDGLQPATVGSFKGNAFGIHDTAGNVAEWTQDCYRPNYQGAPTDGSAWESGQCLERVVRGGSYASSSKALRSANRERFSLDTRLDNLGFRLVRER